MGEIGNSDEDALTLDGLLLINRDEDQSGSETRALSIADSVTGYSLFEGEVVALEGTVDQKRFIVDRIIKPKPANKLKRLQFDEASPRCHHLLVVGQEGLPLCHSRGRPLHAGQGPQLRGSRYFCSFLPIISQANCCSLCGKKNLTCSCSWGRSSTSGTRLSKAGTSRWKPTTCSILTFSPQWSPPSSPPSPYSGCINNLREPKRRSRSSLRCETCTTPTRSRSPPSPRQASV